jgi:ornithine cyclodeaminase
MRVITAEDLSRIFTYADLIEALRQAFRQHIITPERHHHNVEIGEGPAATLLLMPAWHDLSTAPAEPEGGFLGVKIVTVHPGNAARGKASVSGLYYLVAGGTGEPLAVIDGGPLTLWRTAAASALAASYLARADACRLVMVGAGALAPHLISAHASVRPITAVSVWNRNSRRAEQLAEILDGRGYAVQVAVDLAEAVREADIISCATLAKEPLVKGAWLKEGAHLDLVGAYTPEMRESDDDAVTRASIFVDTRPGATKEGGDVLQPMRDRVIRSDDIVGDLFDLCRGTVVGRRTEGEITLFKSVGTAVEDLAAARLAFARYRPPE